MPIADIGLRWAPSVTIAVGVAIAVGLHLVARRALRDMEEDGR
jgi:hypothetical protein